VVEKSKERLEGPPFELQRDPSGVVSGTGDSVGYLLGGVRWNVNLPVLTLNRGGKGAGRVLSTVPPQSGGS